VTINRFYFDRETKKKEKICRPVSIPIDLVIKEAPYRLRSIVIHAGKSSNYGHYYAVAKDAKEQWWLLNDTEVSAIDKDITSFLSSLS